MKWLINYIKDRYAAYRLNERFYYVTGHPIYGATPQEGREFRKSGLTAHMWLSASYEDGWHPSLESEYDYAEWDL